MQADPSSGRPVDGEAGRHETIFYRKMHSLRPGFQANMYVRPALARPQAVLESILYQRNEKQGGKPVFLQLALDLEAKIDPVFHPQAL